MIRATVRRGKHRADAGRSYQSLANRQMLRGARIGVVREFMKSFLKADEDSIRIGNQAIADLAKLGATIVDPGPDGFVVRKSNC